MDGMTLLRGARRVGLAVAQDGDHLVVRGPRRLEREAQRLLAHKAQVLRALRIERSEVAWRVEAMRARAPEHGPIPLLLAQPDAVRGPGCCCSCGDRLERDDRYRCRPCVEAAIHVLETLP
ncbi:MAG: hypothetical protein IVW53_14700 [Chloroflexi bacterium]|nr:hypothetical protein [Chloroflexota bacterium]